MNRTDVLIAMAEVAHTGGAVTPEDAIAQLAMIIDDLEPSCSGSDLVAEMLLRIGACVWKLQQEQLRLVNG
jgi:hypothetical protein